MTLLGYVDKFENDFDTFDTDFDSVVTVCHIAEEDVSDEYDKFCRKIMSKVEVIDEIDECVGKSLIVNWSNLIQSNIEKFKSFTDKWWRYSYEDDEDEFIYQWINEINQYMAGNVSFSFYNVLCDFVDTLE